jgi:hypothetical protein
MDRGEPTGPDGRRPSRALKEQAHSPATGTATLDEEFFDAAFLAELEDLANAQSGFAAAPPEISSALHLKLSAVLADPEASSPEALLSEEGFAALPAEALTGRTNALIAACREGEPREAARAVDNLVVFFQALLPTLSPEGAREITRLFYRLIPTLIHIAHADFGTGVERDDGLAAFASLERILIEISSVRLTPAESELIFRNVDQMVGFMSVGDYALANDVIATRLLGIIVRNRLARSLFRLMEVEVSIQRYLKEKLGHSTPRIRIPADLPHLAAYAPIRVFSEESSEGLTRQFIEIQLPDVPILKDIVLHLVAEGTEEPHQLRLDALGSAQLCLPDGTYRLGLVYQPE